MLYNCNVCGYVYNEDKKDVKWENLPKDWVCPVCESGIAYFDREETDQSSDDGDRDNNSNRVNSESGQGYLGDKEQTIIDTSLGYLKDFERKNDDVEAYMDMIHEMAKTGKTVIEPMRSRMAITSWRDILILGAQLHKRALDEHDKVSTTTIIGKNAKKPLVFEHPVFITHMSFGALSKEMKMSLARGSAEVRTAMCSGEGGILRESMEASYKYIFEYVPNKYSVTTENLMNVDAIEVKIGQGTKPGMGGHLPGGKVTKEIAEVRNKPMGEDIISPSRFEEIKTKEDLKDLVDTLREISCGRPIGVKIAAGHIEQDLAFIKYAEPDFITIDGRGGGTGASPKVVKDATTVPTIYALARARKYMDENDMKMSLIITGGLRVSSDFAKAIAMGADAIAIGSAAMMATACQQYKVCNTGKCPVGVATQDPQLRQRLSSDHGAMRLSNYLKAVLEELKTFARITGHKNIHDLSVEDLCTVSDEIAKYCNIPHA